MYSALLDACVLVPNALCDTLLRLAERGFYGPLWSARILDETSWALQNVHPDIPHDRIRRRIDLMDATSRTRSSRVGNRCAPVSISPTTTIVTCWPQRSEAVPR